jgi:hypothetical protein
MFTRFLFKPSLAFTICALVLLPQIATTGTAFAAGPSSIDNVPNFNCLDVSGSNTLPGNVAPVPSPNPPGTGIKFTALVRVLNKCETTVSGITVTFKFNANCPASTLNKEKYNTFTPTKPSLEPRDDVGDYDVFIVYCTVYSGIVPIGSVPPTSLSVDFDATGTNANGQKVFSPVKTVTVPF